MKWAFALLCFLTVVFFMAVTYHVGYLSGRSSLDRWMRDNNVHRFERRCTGAWRPS